MKNPIFKTDDPRYPPFLQKSFVGYFFQILYPFTDEDIVEFIEFYRLLWSFSEKPKFRFELIKVLNAIKMKKIEEEKRQLNEQLKKLESM